MLDILLIQPSSKRNPLIKESLINAIFFCYAQMLIIKGKKVKLIRLEVFIAVFSGPFLQPSKDETFWNSKPAGKQSGLFSSCCNAEKTPKQTFPRSGLKTNRLFRNFKWSNIPSVYNADYPQWKTRSALSFHFFICRPLPEKQPRRFIKFTIQTFPLSVRGSYTE